MMMRSWTLFALVVILLLLGGAWYYRASENAGTPEPLPQDEEAGWLVSSTASSTFRYPGNPGLTYVSSVDWPPLLNSVPEATACTEAGAATDRAGRTERVSVGGREYCRTTVLEGAAGSTYGQYAYAFGQGSTTAILTFSLRFPQCMNYDEPLRAECLAEQDSFDVDGLADRIMRTAEFR